MSVFFQAREEQVQRQVSRPISELDKEIARIHSIKNIGELADYLAKVHRAGGAYELAAKLHQHEDGRDIASVLYHLNPKRGLLEETGFANAIQGKLDELGGNWAAVARYISGKGVLFSEALEAVSPFAHLDKGMLGMIKAEYLKSPAQQKEILAAFADTYYSYGAMGPNGRELSDSEVFLGLCKEAASVRPAMLTELATTNRLAFTDLKGKKSDTFSVLEENLEEGGERRKVALGCLGMMLSDRQDERAKDRLLGFFHGLNLRKNSSEAVQALISLHTYLERISDVDIFAKIAGEIVRTAPEDDVARLVLAEQTRARGEGGLEIAPLGRAMGKEIAPIVLARIGSFRQPQNLNAFHHLIVAAHGDGLLEPQDMKAAEDYFARMFSSLEKDGQFFQAGAFVSTASIVSTNPAIMKSVEEAALKYAARSLVEPQLGAHERLAELYDGLSILLVDRSNPLGVVSGLAPWFGKEAVLKVAKDALVAATSGQQEIGVLLNGENNASEQYRKLVSCIVLAVAWEFRDSPDSSSETAALVASILNSDALVLVKRAKEGVGVYSNTVGSDNAGVFFRALQIAAGETASTPQMLDLLFTYLGSGSVGKDGKFYVEMIAEARHVQYDVESGEQAAARWASLHPHLFEQFQSETRPELRLALLSCLLEDAARLENFDNLVSERGSDEKMAIAVLQAYIRSSQKMGDDGRVYGIIGSRSASPTLKKQALIYIKGADGQAAAKEAALSIFYNEHAEYVSRKMAIPDNSYALMEEERLFAPGEFDSIAAKHCVGKLSAGGLGAPEYELYLKDALHHLGNLKRHMEDAQGAGRENLRQQIEGHLGQVSSLIKTGIAAGGFSENVITGVRQRRPDEGESVKNYYRQISAQEPIASLAGLSPADAAEALALWAGNMLHSGRKISQEEGYAVLNFAERMLETATFDAGAPEALRTKVKQAFGSLDRLFSAEHLAIVNAGAGESALEPAMKYVRLRFPFRTKEVKDEQDPYENAVRTVLAGGEIARLQTELESAHSLYRGGKISRADFTKYSFTIAGQLDDRQHALVLNSAQEEALFEALTLFDEGSYTIRMENAANLLMRNPRNRKRVEQFLADGIGSREAPFEKERLALLAKPVFNSGAVNAALAKATLDGSIGSDARVGALQALHAHNAPIDSTLLQSEEYDVRQAAAAAFEGNILADPKKAGKVADKNLASEQQPSAIVRKNMADAVSRADPNAEERLAKAMAQEKWANDAAIKEYTDLRIVLPTVRERLPGDLEKEGDLNLYSHSQSMAISEGEFGQSGKVAGISKVKENLGVAIDNEIPRYLLSMGIPQQDLDVVMANFDGLKLSYTNAEAGVAMSERAAGVTVIDREKAGSPPAIHLDADKIRDLARQSGLNEQFLVYDIAIHEFFHVVSQSELMPNRYNKMSGYLIDVGPAEPGIPLTEPLTEFFSTLFELYRSEGSESPEVRKHAESIGIEAKDVLDRMDNGYPMITQSPNFVNWLKVMGVQTVFKDYMNGDLEGLIKETYNMMGPGAFEAVFPRKEN